MALSDHKLEKFNHPVDDLGHTPNLGADALQAWFDSNSYELKDKHNALIDELEGEMAKKADASSLHSHDNKSVLDSITETPVTHEELSAVETNAYDYAVDLNDSTNARFADHPTKDETQLMCDLTLNAAKDYVDEKTAEKIGEAPTDGNTYGRKNGAWAIVELPENIPTITMAEADDFLDGVAIVTENTDILSSEVSGTRHFNKHILVCSSEYDIYDGYGTGNFVQDSDRRYTQTLFCADGSIKKRYSVWDGWGYTWSEWEDVSANVDLTDYVKNTDYANLTKAGVVKVDTDSVSGHGIYTNNGILTIAPATYEMVSAKESYNRPITPAYLEHAVEVCTNQDSTATLTESQLKLPPSTQYLKDVVGDIDTVLDGIIAMQNSLIGGDSV